MASSDADVITRVRKVVSEHARRIRFHTGSTPLVVAVSGGADSTCLLDALVAVTPEPSERLIVAHVDHGLREQSGHDAEHVRSLAATYGVRCEVVSVDVPALAAADHRGLEEAARIARYRALRSLSWELGCGRAVTGHTLDDSNETVLMHLLRGSGRTGLAGIKRSERLDDEALGQRRAPVGASPSQQLLVERPLLSCRRAETRAYCSALGLDWRDDPTNDDPSFQRNRVRHHLLPTLRTYNASVDEALARVARVLRDEEELLEALAAQRYGKLVVVESGCEIVEHGKLRKQPLALQRRIVRRCAAALGHTELGFDAVERALAVGEYDGPPRAQLGGGVVVERKGDRLVFSKESDGQQAEGES